MVHEFDELNCALIDACSIIYMRKAGFLKLVGRVLDLYSIKEVINETGFDDLEIELIDSVFKDKANDQKLVACALEIGMSVISEDKKILNVLKGEGVLFYNALVILNFLLYRDVINIEEYQQYFQALEKIARYDDYVYAVADQIHKEVVAIKA